MMIQSAEEVAISLKQKDYNDGFISNPGTLLPALADRANQVTYEIFNSVRDYFIREVNEGKMPQVSLPFSIYRYTLLWSALAGIGAMELWNRNGKALLDKGIVESLTEARGFGAMEEYVLNLVTDGAGSAEAKDLKARLETHIQPMVYELISNAARNGGDQNASTHQFIDYCMGLYYYGLILQDDRAAKTKNA